MEAQIYYGSISNLSGGVPLQSVSASTAIAIDGQIPTTYNYNIGIQRELPQKTANFYRPYIGYGGQGGANQAGSLESFNANSNYNALQVSVQHRASRRLAIGANYSGSKGLGTASSDFAIVSSVVSAKRALTRKSGSKPIMSSITPSGAALT